MPEARGVAGSPARDSLIRRIPLSKGGGALIAVHDFRGTGAPIVLAHATGLHGLVWRPLAEALTGFHVFGLDHRGHGDSPLPEGPEETALDWRRFAEDILAVIDGLGLSRPIGIGHSAGGAAMLLAEEARPGTFAALALYEPVVIAADPPLGRDRDNWLAAGARRRRRTFTSRDDAYEAYAAKAPFNRWTRDAVSAYVGHGFADQTDGTVRLKCRPEDEAVIYEMATAHPAFTALAKVSCPVLLLAGDESEFATLDDRMGRVAAALPHAESQVLPGLDHFGPMEDPHAVARAVLQFLQRQHIGREDPEEPGS
ncbi:MAG: alpha/beta fold hydrolase [Acidimicrobiales bacterium]